MASAKAIPFTKMHGIGNDFVVIDEITGSPRDARGQLPKVFPPAFARKLGDRRFGVGCDQILRLVPAREAAKADLRMEVLNSDGSEAEMCGNGIRAAALYLRRYGSGLDRYRIETLAGLQVVEIMAAAGVPQVRVNMGPPRYAPQTEKLEFKAGGSLQQIEFREVSVGNPHAVTFVPDLTSVPLASWGPMIETDARFPQRTNVEFVQVLSKDEIRIRVWERGAGATLACGTGACAAVVAASLAGKIGSRARVHLPGGALEVEWKGGAEPVWMTGPAEEVYSGTIEI